ncbi:NADP-dependent oxidoreductase domain-containing protein [Lipomyces kononenkoae]|uniref:NADP-dependent oxidoreductase domain-containing protein n=1 Tax=Lipomyces kononenkoae TaxID=34357 RepID=A0ACC3SQR3_LIPKO
MANQIKLIFGTAFIAPLGDETINEFLRILEHNGVKELDSARLYKGSEEALGKAGAPSRFTIDTKAPGFFKGSLSKSSVLAGIEKSFNDLGVEHVDTYFLHCPDPDTPLEETLSVIQELFEAGKFDRWGLSNFTPAQVQQIYDFMSAKGYVLPTVYQGNYNAVARANETDLLPLLRKLAIKFYAYSPIAGGFLVKDVAAIKDGIAGDRWGKDEMYSRLYGKPKLLAALDEWQSIADEAGVTKAALAYRWVAFNAHLDAKYGDAVIFGASSVKQLQETLKALHDGPLPSTIATKIDSIWENIKDEAPVDNYNG